MQRLFTKYRQRIKSSSATKTTIMTDGLKARRPKHSVF